MILVECICWNAVVFALDEQRVRWYWCMVKIAAVIACFRWMHYQIAISYTLMYVLFKYATIMAMTHCSCLILFPFKCMERYGGCRVGFGRAESTLVLLVHALIWNKAVLLGVRCTDFNRTYTHVTSDATAMMVTIRGCAFISILVEYIHGTVSCRHWTNRAYVSSIVDVC